MSRKTIILHVDEDKAEGLVLALQKRPYIDAMIMDREERKRLRDCPACNRRLSKEVYFKINEKLILQMLAMLKVMAISKTVILINKNNPIKNIPAVEHARCVEFDPKMLARALALGLVKEFIDGLRETYFTDVFDFFLNEESHSPCNFTTLDGKVIDVGGSMFLDEVKLKDENAKSILRRDLRDAIREIPDSTITFAKNGQMSLV